MKILIVFPNWIGDVVMSLPAVEVIKNFYKNKEIYGLIRKSVYPLIEENLKDWGITPLFYEKKNLINTLKLIKILKKYNFEKVYLFPRSYRMFLISVLSQIKDIYGFGDPNDIIKRKFMKLFIPRTKEILSIHRVFYYLLITKEINPENIFNPPYIKIHEKYKIWADNFLKNIKNKILIGINPGSTYGEAKCWDAKNFVKLINKLKVNLNCEIFLFGGEDNVEKCKDIEKNVKFKIFNLAGKLTLIESAALINKMDVFITNDTGPMHIGDALNVKIVAIFGPTDVNETSPFRKNGIILYKKLECSPCKKRICPFGHNKCMKEISVDEVFDSVKKLIDMNKNKF